MTIKFSPAKIFLSSGVSFVVIVSSFRAAFCCNALGLRDRFGVDFGVVTTLAEG